MLATLITLLVCQTVGEALSFAFSWPVPGPVIGMVLLFCILILRKGAAEAMAPTSSKLLEHLSLLFLPAGVGIMAHTQRIANEWLAITVALIISTALALVVTACVLQRLRK